MSPSIIRTHRILGLAAVLHALIIVGIVIGMALRGWFPCGRWYVAFVTLWLAWPIILLLHGGRSLIRVALPLLISVPLLWWFAWSEYSLCAGEAVGLPPGASIYPRDLWEYFTAVHKGRTAAERDIRSDVLAIEEYGLPKPIEWFRVLHDRFGVEQRQIAGDTDVTMSVIGHAEGYNEVSKAEIRRRFGARALEDADEQAENLYRENTRVSEEQAKSLARKISSIPAGSKVTLESLRITDGHFSVVAADFSSKDIQSITEVIHWLETVFASTVPADAPAFDSTIWADLTSSARPDLQITSSTSAPYPLHMQIYNKLKSVPDVRCQTERIRMTMEFVVK